MHLTRLLALFIILALYGCGSKKGGYVSRPTRSTINPQTDLLEVSSVAYHVNDTVTKIFLEIKNEHLIYKRPDTSRAFYADLRIDYRLLPEVNSRTVTDSSSFRLIDRSPQEIVPLRSLQAQFTVRARRGHQYYLEVDVFDNGKKTVHKAGIRILKEDKIGRQNFLLFRHDSVSFTNRFMAGQDLKVEIAGQAVQKVYVDCFFKDFGPALPPFSSKAPDPLKYRPDSTFEILTYNNVFLMRTAPRGFYHIKLDREKFDGVSIFSVDESFPGVRNTWEMIQCTRYIMFKEEFESCRDAADKKAAIDDFWLNVGGSLERARELLKRYYSRVQEANRLYSSYTQGWKTDRGMIYIVMGPPANVYRSASEEIWVYGNENNPNALRYKFRKTHSPFSDNDFILERSPFFKEPYHTAVEYWRQGLIYVDRRR